jgi:CheY-like chemotaxis protein
MSKQIDNENSQILVADDDPMTLLMVKTILEQEGYSVITARDGRETYKLLSSGKPFAAAIFDVMMPHINGTDIVKHMQSEKRLMKIPVIIMTAEQNSLLLPESYKSGAIAFLPKPFTIFQLQTLLRLVVPKD